MPAASPAPRRWLVVLAFACVYIIWGSSYLGISVAIETIPPFLMTGFRFVLAGLLLMGWALLRGESMPGWRQWRSAFIAGGLLFLCNNALIVVAELAGVPTGMIALLIATTPMWVVIVSAVNGTARPNRMTIIGLMLGTLGITLLVDLNGAFNGGGTLLIGMAGAVTGALFWVLGSLYARSADLPKNTMLSTSMQLLCGGLLQFGLAAVTGDFARLDVAAVSMRSLIAMFYLMIFASVIAFTAFTWLMRNVNPALVATYAYVNPVIAVLLGALILDEPLTPRIIIAGSIIIGAVIVISRATAGGKRGDNVIEIEQDAPSVVPEAV